MYIYIYIHMYIHIYIYFDCVWQATGVEISFGYVQEGRGVFPPATPISNELFHCQASAATLADPHKIHGQRSRQWD